MNSVKVGVIGYGYWGPNLVRNFMEMVDAEVTWVSDVRQQRLDVLRMKHPGVQSSTNADDMINDPNVDAIVISTPVSTHFELASKGLRAGKHVLVEKPMTQTAEQGRRLIDLAAEKNLTLMVDHTFVYTGAVRKIRDLIANDDMGRLYYYDSVRVNLGLFQHDVDVMWDLAVHDLSIMHHVLGENPVAVAATGMAHVPGKPEDVAYLTCFFDNELIAHFHVNWLAPVKIRKTLIGGEKRMIVFDDLEPSEKIKVYDKGITVTDNPEDVYNLLVGYRSGDMWAPQIDGREALRAEAEHFVDCIRSGMQPVTNGHVGLDVVRILEAATSSMRHRGAPIELNHHDNGEGR